MITRQELSLKNEWWVNNEYQLEETKLPRRDLFSLIENNLDHPLMLNIVGLRRVGKSTILKQLIGQLLDQQIKPFNIFYFLFDYSTQIQKSEFLDEVLSIYFKDVINKPSLSLQERVYILLDEIQYIENWQSILKRYYDLSNKKIKFIVTGSQSVLLKDKFRESLAGRVFDYYLPPLSFREFIRINYNKVKIIEQFDLLKLPEIFKELSYYNAYYGAEIAKLSHEYITTGQFPETSSLSTTELRHEYIAESVIGKVVDDCIRIFSIEKSDEFKLIVKYLLNNVSSIFEQTNISREIALSRLTLDKYLEYLKESYIFEILYKYHKSLIKRGRILKKIYTPCINFTCALNHYKESHLDEVPQAFGKIIENIVYNVFKLKYHTNKLVDNLSFWRQGEKEIDFLINFNNKILPVEVKFSNNINAKELITLIDYIKVKKIEYGVVVTKNELGQKELNGQTLYFVPYYLVLLMI
ncbi:MAG: ATP-binding protein [Candidatus Kuenenbacteria bacterium]